jgi:GT2 family glycosyltransferase
MNKSVAVVIFTTQPSSFCIKCCYTYFVNNTTILFELFIVDTAERNVFDCRKEFIGNCEQDYICIIPEDYLLGKNWLENLIHHYKKDEKAGILSIRNGSENCCLSPIQVDDEFESEMVLENVFKTPNNWVEGLMFFEKKRIIEHLDSCSKLFIKNHEDIALSLALSLNGYTNYYIRKQTAISLKNDTKQQRTDEQIKEFKKIVNQFVKEEINE